MAYPKNVGCVCVYIIHGRSRHLNKHKLITAKVIIDNKTNEVKIVIGKFDNEKSMIEAAQEICEHLSIDFNDELLALTETIH